MDPVFATQANWYIDGINGNDNNCGGSATTALKTHAELERRWGFNVVLKQNVNVYILSDLDEVIRATVRIDDGGGATPYRLRYLGNPLEVMATGTLTAVTNFSAGTTYNVIEDAAISSWTTYIGKRIRITSGTNTNMTAWLAKTVSTHEARTSVWFNVDPMIVPTPVNPTIINPSVGDTYVIERLPLVRGFEVTATRLSLGSGSDFNHVVVDSLEFLSSQQTAIVATCHRRHASFYFMRCKFGGGRSIQIPSCYMQNCYFEAGMSSFLGGFVIIGGLVRTFFSVLHGTTLTLNQHVLFQGLAFQIFIQGDGTISSTSGGFAFFDCTNECLSVSGGGRVALTNTALLWGSGNTNRAVNIQATCSFAYVTKPTLTGSNPGVNDTLVGGVVKAWADIPYVNPDKMCGIISSV